MGIQLFLQRRRAFVIGLAAALPLLACALSGLFRDTVANTDAALGLVLIVVAAAATGIRTAGLVAALSSALWFDYFLTAPYHAFTILDRADITTAVLLVAVGVAVSEIALWGRRQQAVASRERGYLDGVLNTVATVGGGQVTTQALVDRVAEMIVEVLQVDGCRFDTGTAPDVLATLADDATMTYDGLPHDVARSGLPTDTEIALPVRGAGVTQGRFLLTAATRVVRPTRDQLRVAAALADQVGTALAVEAGGRFRPER